VFRPVVIYVALLALTMQEVSQAEPALKSWGIPSPLHLSQVIAAAALFYAALHKRVRLSAPPVFICALLLLATQELSVLHALDPALAKTTTTSMAKDLLTLFLAFGLLRSVDWTPNLIRWLVLMLAALCGLSVIHEYVLHNHGNLGQLDFVNSTQQVDASTARHEGPVKDANFWGRVLVLFLPFALAEAFRARRALLRIAWFVPLVLFLWGIFLTQSRGTFLGTGVAVVVFFAFSGWRIARWLILTPLVVAIMLATPSVGTRLQTLSQVKESTAGIGDPSLILRAASLKAGELMIKEHTIYGIGAGNYEEFTPQFEKGLPFATHNELGVSIAPHNSFVEYFAETGVFGLLAFLLFLASIAFCGIRTCMITGRRGPPGELRMDRLIGAASVASIAGWTMCSSVLHVRQFRTLLIVAAIAAALYAEQKSRGVPPRRYRTPNAWRSVLLVVVLGAALCGPTLIGGQDKTSTWHYDRTVLVLQAAPLGPGGGTVNARIPASTQILETVIVIASHVDPHSSLSSEAVHLTGAHHTSIELSVAPRTNLVQVTADSDDARRAQQQGDALVAAVQAAARTVGGLRPIVDPQVTPVLTVKHSLRLSVIEAEVVAWLGAAVVFLGIPADKRYRERARAAEAAKDAEKLSAGSAPELPSFA